MSTNHDCCRVLNFSLGPTLNFHSSPVLDSVPDSGHALDSEPDPKLNFNPSSVYSFDPSISVGSRIGTETTSDIEIERRRRAEARVKTDFKVENRAGIETESYSGIIFKSGNEIGIDSKDSEIYCAEENRNEDVTSCRATVVRGHARHDPRDPPPAAPEVRVRHSRLTNTIYHAISKRFSCMLLNVRTFDMLKQDKKN
ncbi:hypothetical protein EVAR_75391_1 [Eumeta japonica]|uniref:Uncharacterized protein n=1 Tax=Eumeta variegata TaxID=151549 RepID=A0A4C1TKS1_EUMVA|nr:hypothetical protein EVAR_75391_1 [Eumeta japonica]